MDESDTPLAHRSAPQLTEPASPAPRAHPRFGRRWLRGPAGAVVLVVLGAVLALAAEMWREEREQATRAAAALASIEDELRENRRRIVAAREQHLRLVDVLGQFEHEGTLPPAEVYMGGLFNPALVGSTAWQTARESGAVTELPLPLVLGLATVYEAQSRYSGLGEAMIVGIMHDVRRDGMDVVLRDRYRQFVPLALDFSSREGELTERYDRALALLAAQR